MIGNFLHSGIRVTYIQLSVSPHVTIITLLSTPCVEIRAQRGELDAAKRALIDYPLSRFSNFFLSDLASQKNRHPTEKEGRKVGRMD